MTKQNPDHYQLGTIQPWDYIVSQDMDYLTGNIVKYITRAGTKPGESKMDDLLKAQAYLNKLIETTNANQTTGLTRPGGALPSYHGSTSRDRQFRSVADAAATDS